MSRFPPTVLQRYFGTFLEQHGCHRKVPPLRSDMQRRERYRGTRGIYGRARGRQQPDHLLVPSKTAFCNTGTEQMTCIKVPVL